MPALTGGMDPVPYFIAAYGLATFGLLGFAAWTIHQRRQLRLMLAAVKKPTRTP